MAATIVIETNLGEPWIETSPNDPQEGTVRATGSSTMVSEDDGPWTIQFPEHKIMGTIPAMSGGTKVTNATVTLVQSGSYFCVQVKPE